MKHQEGWAGRVLTAAVIAVAIVAVALFLWYSIHVVLLIFAGVLIAMVQIGIVPAWIVFIIVTREFLVSGLRSLAAAKGKVIPAGKWAARFNSSLTAMNWRRS